MKAMRKCNDEIYQLAKDQALVKNLKKPKDLSLFVYVYTLSPQTNIYTFHPIVAILSTVLRVSHSAKPLG
jgi:hypothetical protein